MTFKNKRQRISFSSHPKFLELDEGSKFYSVNVFLASHVQLKLALHERKYFNGSYSTCYAVVYNHRFKKNEVVFKSFSHFSDAEMVLEYLSNKGGEIYINDIDVCQDPISNGRELFINHVKDVVGSNLENYLSRVDSSSLKAVRHRPESKLYSAKNFF
ncbi:MAG: hypothetical protein ABIC91_00865 [Nanoarchaeota archaeon]|nr:hypothetical protein [Nanoarchaeota archaeon]MBU1029923.1 hypothetical protein [Nanoarchaeota archaeon]MBU1850515.1 hypothetical protein [Nanoarchaeota archaeon]